jgi:predicted transcriptional regulator
MTISTITAIVMMSNLIKNKNLNIHLWYYFLLEEDLDESALISELFMELASATRFSILASLNNKPAKLSSLSRELDTTVQDIYRNLNRLVQEGLVRRADGVFDMTEYGRIVMKQVPDFMIMKKHRKFFEDHSLAAIVPDKFLQRIGALQDCKTVISATAVFQSLKKMQSSATRSLRIIVSQTWPEEGEILIERANHGVKIYSLVGCNTIFPKNVVENIMPKINELISKGIIERRMIEKVNTAIFIVDNQQAALAFPNTRGEVDMNTLFVGEDPMFCEWCSDYFDHMWKDSKPFDLSKIKIVEY